MTNEKGFAAYDLLGHMADDMIVDALLPEDRGAGVAPVKKERSRRLSAFLESGWGVAIICALVAVSVMGGIIWAGNEAGPVTPPGGVVESESKGNTIETNTPLSEEREVVVYGADGACYPTRFLCNSTDLTEDEEGLGHGVTADGPGFEGHMDQYGGADLPTVVFANDVEIADYVDIAENYTITQISMYDMNMVEQVSKTPLTGDGEMFATRFLSRWLSVGKWYVSFRVTHREGDTHHCECDYAFVADVRPMLDSIVTRNCTVRTNGDRYKWGGNNIYMAILTSTVPGAILDIGEESWQLLNLDTDEYVEVMWAVVDSNVTTQGDRTLLSPSSPTDFGWYYRLLQFDWETTPPGRYRLTYTGTEPADGEEYPYYDFEIYDPEPLPKGIYVQGGDDYVIPKEAMLWVEFWDENGGGMLSGDGPGHSDIREYASELPMLTVREGLAMDVMNLDVNAALSYCVLYDRNFEILYEGEEWINTTDYVIGPFYVVFTVRTQGEYIPEADAYEGDAYEYAFRLDITPYSVGSCIVDVNICT